MKTKVFVSLLILPVLFLFSRPAESAYRGKSSAKEIDLKKIFVNAPSSGKSGFDGYEPQGLGGLNIGTSKYVGRWIRIEALYTTRKAWSDEVSLEFLVLTQNGIVLKGHIAQINVAEGPRHFGVMYLHPTTVQRFGDIEKVAVKIYEKGVLKDTEQWPSYSKKEWWTKYPVNEGYLKKLAETPFFLNDSGKYEDTR